MRFEGVDCGLMYTLLLDWLVHMDGYLGYLELIMGTGYAIYVYCLIDVDEMILWNLGGFGG